MFQRGSLKGNNGPNSNARRGTFDNSMTNFVIDDYRIIEVLHNTPRAKIFLAMKDG